ncbi:hypothetical protein DEO23_14170 [Brachybacterium endophyticum]|uniref:Uncharacterized protein n=1 Tax=Brachybacterium endophyticum TaxID=2182385 RepID=A0A2U2RH72_9MICO|nr:hypothetical protein [Brachybacterium endophyticum]PWH05222.1 hypothetical protein DEO23_14170 [Brachybacterium endophyticum]
MATPIRKKHARFFRAYVLDSGTRVDIDQVDWQQVLKDISELETPSRTNAEGLRFEAFEHDHRYMLGMHKPLDPDFLSKEDPATGSIVDAMNAEAADEGAREAERWFRSTGVVFFEVGNAFALTQGSVGAVKQGAVRGFLEMFQPLGAGKHWGVEPLIDDSQLDEFRGVNRAKAFETTIDSTRMLFDANGEPVVDAAGPAMLSDKFAASIGGDVRISMKIELLSQSQGIKTQRSFYDSIRHDVARFIAPAARSKVTTINDDGTHEVLELAAHDLASTFEVDPSESEVVQFSTLMARLSDVRAEMESRVNAIIEGAGDDEAGRP